MHRVDDAERAGLTALRRAVLDVTRARRSGALALAGVSAPAPWRPGAAPGRPGGGPRAAAGMPWRVHPPASLSWLAETLGVDSPPPHRRGSDRTGDDDSETARVVALVDLARDGDSEAFGQLYDHYVDTVYRFLYHRVGSHQVAEDLTSETFYRALRSLPRFTWQGKDFGAWLVTISRNLVADHYKSGRRRLEITTDDFSDHNAASAGPEEDVIASVTNETLLRCLHQLADEQQECLVLRFLQGFSIAETAAALERSEGAVKQLQLRAVRNLARLLPEGFR